MALTLRNFRSLLLQRKCSSTYKLLNSQLSVSRNGFEDYEKNMKEISLREPVQYNFVRDCFDVHAAQGAGLRRNDRVVVVLPKIPEWWILNLACIRAGLVLCPGTSLLTQTDILARLASCNASAIVLHDSKAEVMETISDTMPSNLVKICVGEQRVRGWLNFQELLNKSTPTHKCVDSFGNEELTVFFTSGTTGLPKMASHTHSYAFSHVVTGKYWLDLTERDVIWANSDTGWAKAAYSNVFGPWIQGSTVFVHNSVFDPEVTLKILRDYPITTFCTVPTGYRLLINQKLETQKLKTLDHAVSAGEPLNPEVVDVWREKTGITIREGYGQTETVLACGSFKCIKNKPGSMGKAAPGHEVKVIDEYGTEKEPFQEGDLAIKKNSLGLFKGYVSDPVRTEQAFRNGYYVTGDRAFRDEEGYFWFVGRGDDIIISAGYRIGPFEVESVLLLHDAVVESAVVSSPDSIRGEIVKAFVVLRDDYKMADQQFLITDLQQHVKSLTAPYKYPRVIEFVDSLPKTVSGKILRIALRKQEWSRLTK